MRVESQLELLARFQSEFQSEYDGIPTERTDSVTDYFVNNGTFESVDAEIYYSMIRWARPERIIEVGAGSSTLLAAKAVRRNAAVGHPCDLTSIDPFPPDTIQRGLPGLTRLIIKQVQDLPITVFTELRRNDILFIDSSHVVRIGSDVLYEVLDILPQLNSGVLVHIHDIFLPAEYPRDWVLSQMRFWSEQYLVHAFLSFNREFEVVWAGSYMHLAHPDRLKAAFASYRRDRCWPGSLWLRRVARASQREPRYKG